MILHSIVEESTSIFPKNCYSKNGIMYSYNGDYIIESKTELPDGVYDAIETPKGDKLTLIDKDISKYEDTRISNDIIKYKVDKDFFDKLFRLSDILTEVDVIYSEYICLDHKNNNMVATDGYKLKVIRYNLPPCKLKPKVLVSNDLIKQIKLIKSKNKNISLNAEIIYDSLVYFIVDFGSFRIYCHIPLYHPYPDYKSLLAELESKYNKHYLVDKNEMLEVIKKIKKEKKSAKRKKAVIDYDKFEREVVDINFEKGIMSINKCEHKLNIKPVSDTKEEVEDKTILMPINNYNNHYIRFDVKYLETVLQSHNKNELTVSIFSNAKGLRVK